MIKLTTKLERIAEDIVAMLPRDRAEALAVLASARELCDLVDWSYGVPELQKRFRLVSDGAGKG
jgi:hypothetical protein